MKLLPDVPALTGVRAIAACLVFAFHLNSVLLVPRIRIGPLDVTPLVHLGWSGVTIFFVLSGFLISLHFMERMQARDRGAVLARYLESRCRRILPAYWFQLVVLLAAAWFATGKLPVSAGQVLAHFALLQNFDAASAQLVNPVYWTLPTEFAFYLLLPLILLACGWPAGGLPPPRRTLAVVVVLCLGSLAWRMYVIAGASSPASATWSMNQLPGTFDSFAIGVLAAAVYAHLRARAPQRMERLGDALLVVGTVVATWLLYYYHRKFNQHYTMDGWSRFAWAPLFALACAVAIFGASLRGRLARALLENRVVFGMGVISYGIYLWHLPMLLLVSYSAPELLKSGPAYSFAAIALTLAASTLSYFAIERPLFRPAPRGLPESVPRSA